MVLVVVFFGACESVCVILLSLNLHQHLCLLTSLSGLNAAPVCVCVCVCVICEWHNAQHHIHISGRAQTQQVFIQTEYQDLEGGRRGD